jgi:hypothetical protein
LHAYASHLERLEHLRVRVRDELDGIRIARRQVDYEVATPQEWAAAEGP